MVEVMGIQAVARDVWGAELRSKRKWKLLELQQVPAHNCTGYWTKRERESECRKFTQAVVMGRRKGRTPLVERHQGHIPNLTHFLLVLWCDACFESPVTATKQASSPLVINLFFSLLERRDRESEAFSSLEFFFFSAKPKIEEQKRRSEELRMWFLQKKSDSTKCVCVCMQGCG